MEIQEPNNATRMSPLGASTGAGTGTIDFTAFAHNTNTTTARSIQGRAEEGSSQGRGEAMEIQESEDEQMGADTEIRQDNKAAAVLDMTVETEAERAEERY